MHFSLSLQFFLIVGATTALLVNGQTGPVPPRLNIAGAIPLSQPRTQTIRVRRPVALRSQNALSTPITQRTFEQPKPVTEAEEDEQPDAYLPQLLREQQLAQAQQNQFQQAAAAFLNNEPNSLQDTPAPQLLQHEDAQLPARFADRSTSVAQANGRPVFNDFGIGRFENSQRFGIDRSSGSRPVAAAIAAPQPQAAPQQTEPVRITRPRPTPRAQYEAQAAPVHVVSRPKPIQPRPSIEQNQFNDARDTQGQRRLKPVAQTIRKWREENEDGSITWGYENDDGSFKEEFIGTDCVTKGTYGYIDPDGNKREYHYETGIKCDPNLRDNEEELQENGFVNYEENKLVLPNGLQIDMSQIGKKKSKRPNNIYKN